MEQADAPAANAPSDEPTTTPDNVFAEPPAHTPEPVVAEAEPLLSATVPRLHVPKQVGLFAEAVHEYVAEHEDSSIAADVSHYGRMHHALALPTSDNFMVLPSTTSMSTVASLLSDAFKHLDALAPNHNSAVATLEDKYADIWAEIEATKALDNKNRLRRAFSGWKKRALLLNVVRKMSVRAYDRRRFRIFVAWRTRVRLLRRIKVKYRRAVVQVVAYTFQRMKLYAQRSRTIAHKHRRARAKTLHHLFGRWKHHVQLARRVHRCRRKVCLKTLRVAFRSWRTRLAAWRQLKRGVRHLISPLRTMHLRLRWYQWQQQHAICGRQVQLRRDQAQRRRFVLERCFKAWKRQLMLRYRTERAKKRRHRDSVRDVVATWRQYYLARKALRPETWTCDLVGIWLTALFRLPLEVATTCQVSGAELLQLGPRLHIDLHQPSSWAATSLERLLPQMPLFFCASHHRMVLLEAISALASPVASQAARDALARHRRSQLAMVTDLSSLRYFWAQDRELLVYVRRLDQLSLASFLRLEMDGLLRVFQPQKPSHLTLLAACQAQLRAHDAAVTVPTSPPRSPITPSQPLDIAVWLTSVHLAQYIPRFFQAHIDSREKLEALDHAALRDRLYIHSKLHRDRLLKYITELKHVQSPPPHIPLKKGHVPMAASFRLKLALNHVDETTAPPVRPKVAGTAKLQKQLRALFFSVCRGMEDREWSLDQLYTAMQSTSVSGVVAKTQFAHVLRSWSIGLSSAHIQAMWEPLARMDPTSKRGVGYTAFMTFFLDVFEQRYELLALAIQTLQDESHKGEKQREQLSQLLQSTGRVRRILTLAGVDMTRR
ncbi:hypothetical protein SDRG_03383 [Saprolegnia diclina VS20]|uniref:SAM domain-containing protein n=1 Tax=Saprolegnia diclina (strain VS20) TaxID=1156394 RepID=T0S926_SAPDV|nr:hypothetical protein SDRG_03383 [Saprolegnia diclina VS20]EQC39177.1 hypothetical protein SDRG_03383 [Saprolegnia diclina VS20]|eukprot:XP_008607238.1 hypothetical protein SDRG_03383 [Saprolegnia diclina VS20]